MGKTRDILRKIRKGNISCKDAHNKEETASRRDKKRWQEYIRELYKKDLTDLDNHNGSTTQPEREVNWPSEASLQTKLVEVMEFQLSYFKS